MSGYWRTYDPQGITFEAFETEQLAYESIKMRGAKELRVDYVHPPRIFKSMDEYVAVRRQKQVYLALEKLTPEEVAALKSIWADEKK